MHEELIKLREGGATCREISETLGISLSNAYYQVKRLRVKSKVPIRMMPRGFQVWSKDKHREVASRGGVAAHALGVAHEWTPGEASAAGKKGGVARHKNT